MIRTTQRYLPDAGDIYPPPSAFPAARVCREHDERECHCCSRCPECKRTPDGRHYYAARVFPCAVCG